MLADFYLFIYLFCSRWAELKQKREGGRGSVYVDCSDSYLDTQAKPVTVGTKGEVGEGLGHLYIANPNSSMSVMGRWLPYRR